MATEHVPEDSPPQDANHDPLVEEASGFELSSLVQTMDLDEHPPSDNRLVTEEILTPVYSVDEGILPAEDIVTRGMMEQFLSELCEAFSANLAPIMEKIEKIEGQIDNLGQEVRILRVDMSRGLGTITTVKDRVGLTQALTDNQVEMANMRSAVDVVSVGFGKLNSALLQLNSKGIPLGTMPESANYQPVPRVDISEGANRADVTSLSVAKEQVIPWLKTIGFTDQTDPHAHRILSNRTIGFLTPYLAANFPHVGASNPLIRELIGMQVEKTQATFLKACDMVKDIVRPPNTPPAPVASAVASTSAQVTPLALPAR